MITIKINMEVIFNTKMILLNPIKPKYIFIKLFISSSINE